MAMGRRRVPVRTDSGGRSVIGEVVSAGSRLPPNRYVSRLGRAVGGTLARVGCDPIVRREQDHGGVLLLDVRSRTESSAVWTGSYETDERDFLLALLDADDTVLDVGANIGLLTVPIARRLSELGGGRVIAFEPVPVNAERLRRNVTLNQLNHAVTVVEVAAGDHHGRVQLAKEGPDGASDNAMVVLTDDPSAGEFAELSTIDDELEARGVSAVSLIKIDVEGYEVAALRGAARTLAAHRPVVVGEFHNVLLPERGHSFLDVWAQVEPLGYQCFQFAGRLQLERVPEPWPSLGNVVLAPIERIDCVLGRLGI